MYIAMNPLKLKRDSFLINGSYVRYTKRVFCIRSTYSQSFICLTIQKHSDITMKLTIHIPNSVQFAIFFYNRFSLCNFFYNIFHLTNSRFSRLTSIYLETIGKIHHYMKKGRAVRYFLYYYFAVDEPKGCLFIFVPFIYTHTVQSMANQ